MKISQMNIEQFAAAACDLIEPVGRIADTPELFQMLETLSHGADENESPIAFLVRGFRQALPVLMKERLGELLQVLAVLAEKDVDELRTLNCTTVMQLLYEYVFCDMKLLLSIRNKEG